MNETTKVSLPDGWELELPERLVQTPVTGLQEWIEALESGRYPQGHGYLREVVDGIPRYCCLGVKHDLEGVRWKLVPGQTACVIEGGAEPAYGYMGMAGLAPLGNLPAGCRLFRAGMAFSIRTLAELNDHRCPFDTIARVIRHCFRERTPEDPVPAIPLPPSLPEEGGYQPA